MPPRPELGEQESVRRRRGMDMVEEERSLLGLDADETEAGKRRETPKSALTVEVASNVRTKWLVMVLGAFELFACYYASDASSALHDQLEASFAQSEMSISFDTFFGLIYSVYSFPNIILPLGGGVLVDRFGAAFMSLLFCITLVVGQTFVWLGVWAHVEYLVLAGRFVYGIGAESLCVSVSACLAAWFHGSPHMALAMGVSLSISRFGSVITNVLSPLIARAAGVHVAYLVSILVLGLGLPAAAWVLRLQRIRAATEAAIANESGTVDIAAPATLVQSLRAVRRWPASFWMLLVSCMAIYGTIMPFNNIASAFLIERICGGQCCPEGEIGCAAHVAAEERASALMGIPFALSAVGVPMLAFVVDRFGHRASFILAAAITILVVHVLLGFTAIGPIFPLVLQGIGYTIFCTTLWPSIALVAQPEVGTAMGVVTAAQNLALAIIPMSIAGINGSTGGFHAAEFLFISLAAVGIVSGALLNIYDARHANGLLNRARHQTAGGDDLGDEDAARNPAFDVDEASAKQGQVDESLYRAASRMVQMHHEDAESSPLLARGNGAYTV